jgi:hypothetical protein
VYDREPPPAAPTAAKSAMHEHITSKHLDILIRPNLKKTDLRR